jgi:hypothetical protein
MKCLCKNDTNRHCLWETMKIQGQIWTAFILWFQADTLPFIWLRNYNPWNLQAFFEFSVLYSLYASRLKSNACVVKSWSSVFGKLVKYAVHLVLINSYIGLIERFLFPNVVWFTENSRLWTSNTIVSCRWETSYHVWNSKLYLTRGNLKYY